MKLILEPADLLAMFGGGETTEEVRGRIAGMLLSTVDSTEMQAAIEARITQPAKEHVDKILREAVHETRTGYPYKDKLSGWGAQIIKEAFQEQIQKSGMNLDSLLRNLIKEHVDKILNEELEILAKREVKRILTVESINQVQANIGRMDVNKLIREELNKRLERLGRSI